MPAGAREPAAIMSLRAPTNLRRFQSETSTGLNALDYELQAESAAALGDAGRRVERAIDALEALEEEFIDGTMQTNPSMARRRETLIDKAADEVWKLFIQRELLGLRGRRELIGRYRIPKAVLNRVGAFKPPRDR